MKDLSKQWALNVDPKAIQQSDFSANLDPVGSPIMFFIREEVKEAISNFSHGTVGVL